MSHITAKLSNYRQSPRKVRLVASFVKGKTVSDALARLELLPKRASDVVKKLVDSAVSNAKQKGFEEKDLIVRNFTVDEGVIMYRRRARARGSASPIRKRTSHLLVTLEAKDAEAKPKAAKTAKAPAKKVAKPKATAKSKAETITKK